MTIKYDFTENKEFVIEDYDKAKTFAGFLPGIAGVNGIPMWSFYVNRGQAMGSFGVRDKDDTIMEFFPALTLYRTIERQGFRTFIRKNGTTHEIFSSLSADDTVRKLAVEKNRLKITEENLTLDIRVTVTYFTMPGENYAALVRKVEIEKLSTGPNEIELLDGLPQILPTGVSNSSYQAMSNLMKSWFDVLNVENGIAYYKIRGSTQDSAQVDEFQEGNFYLSFSSESGGLIPPIYDMNVIFGENTSFSRPDGWDCAADELHKRRQVPENKVSGGFSGARTALGNKFTLCTVIGHIAGPELINSRKKDFTIDYINKKEKDAVDLVEGLVADVATKTSDSLFNQYIEQCYLDNLLRGGYPLIFKAGGRNLVYHVFSRKHGDTEREYNFFSLEPAFYSQGNGNFRDVNQNRRCDVLINPEAGDFNIKQFMSLIQADGYNPLLVKGCTFTADRAAIPGLLGPVRTHKAEIGRLLEAGFTPGKLVTYIEEHGTELEISNEAYLEKVLGSSSQSFEAEFGEGYWSDHWTYNMDLVDAYLTIYPDRKEKLLFGDNTCRFFYSPVYVLPRADKYVLAGGRVRQYGAVDASALHSADARKGTDWLKTDNGAGCIYETNLFAKLISLALNKFVSLDPFGMGIEMEADRPGWNDAMNGLPGLFGSGLSETAELKRLMTFLIKAASESDREISLYAEAAELLRKTEELLEKNLSGELDDFSYWDQVAGLKEEYRRKIRHGISGAVESFGTKALLKTFGKIGRKLEKGVKKALEYGDGIYPTYFTYEATGYEIIEGKTNPVNGYQNVKVTGFECRPLPPFLEAPSRMLKTIRDASEAEKLYTAVKASGMYDGKLKMYKTSVPLGDTSGEVGRLKAFTPGWLEREAVFLHMEYKYLYSMLEAGLYEQFYDDLRTTLIPFLKPELYGRSTLENSSFIVSSVNPDESMHGRGFVARLTGTTSEMLSIWFVMMAGREVFRFDEGRLTLKLEPVLPGWLFDENGRVSFRFLGKTLVTYINPKRRNTYGKDGVKPSRLSLTLPDGEAADISGPVIDAPYAEKIRSGGAAKIDIFLE